MRLIYIEHICHSNFPHHCDEVYLIHDCVHLAWGL
jgi:hypothetical protein